MYWKRNSKGKIKIIEGKGPRKLNKLLETLYAEVKDKNWDDFEPDSLRVMMAALDRQLNEQGYKISIIREREFHSSKQILEIKPSSSSLVHLVLHGTLQHCENHCVGTDLEVRWETSPNEIMETPALRKSEYWRIRSTVAPARSGNNECTSPQKSAFPSMAASKQIKAIPAFIFGF